MILWGATGWADPARQPSTRKPKPPTPSTSQPASSSSETSQADARPAPSANTPAKKPKERELDPFAQGILLSRRAEWGEALNAFNLAKQQMLFRLNKRQRALLFLYLGLSYIHLLQQQRGINAFEKALLLDACIELPAKLDLSPQIRALFQKTKRPYEAACRRQRAAAARRVVVIRQPPVRRQPPARRPWTPKVPKPSPTIKWSAWGFLGAGVIMLGTAFVFGGLALWDEVKRNEQPMTSEGTASYLDLDQRARERATFANAMFGISGVFLFTGFAMHISQWIQPPPPPPLDAKSPAARILFRD